MMNMKGDKVAKGVIVSFLLLGAIITLVGGFFITGYIVTLILGILFTLSATAGFPVNNNTTKLLLQLENAYSTVLTSVISGLTFAASLIPIAIILLIFAGIFVGGYMLYKKKKGKGGSGPDY